jgi:hypothetical protein
MVKQGAAEKLEVWRLYCCDVQDVRRWTDRKMRAVINGALRTMLHEWFDCIHDQNVSYFDMVSTSTLSHVWMRNV